MVFGFPNLCSDICHDIFWVCGTCGCGRESCPIINEKSSLAVYETDCKVPYKAKVFKLRTFNILLIINASPLYSPMYGFPRPYDSNIIHAKFSTKINYE